MMKHPQTFVVVVVLALASATVAASSGYRWLPGADVVIPVYQTTDDKAGPGPLNGVLAYDRDAHVASVLDVPNLCVVSWGVSPTPGHGAIAHVFQVGLRLFALLHEDGFIRVEQQPEALWCQPLPTVP